MVEEMEEQKQVKRHTRKTPPVEAVPHILPPHCKAVAFCRIMLIIKTMF